MNAVRAHEQKVVETLTGNLGRLAKARKIDYVVGRGRFVDGQTIQVEGGASYRFKNCIVATGSSPTKLPWLDLPTPRVMDSTGALKLEDVPARLLVVGGGYIGLEMGYVYAALGSKVTVVELTDGLLPGVDRDLVRPLHKRLEGLFDKIYLNTKVAKLEETPKGIKAVLEGADVKEKEPVFDRVLTAVGRKPNSRDVGLDKAGVAVDEKGFVKVDEHRRTTAERIYAIGDVAGEPMLAHKATYEGKIAVEVIAGRAGGVRRPGGAGRGLHRPGGGVVRPDGDGGEEAEPRGEGRQVPVDRLRPGDDAGPHRGADEAGPRPGDRPRAGRRHRRRGGRRDDRRGDAGDRDVGVGPRRGPDHARPSDAVGNAHGGGRIAVRASRPHAAEEVTAHAGRALPGGSCNRSPASH